MTKAAILFVLVVVDIAWEPFVIRALWTWFVVPLGLPAISWAQAFGLNLIVSVLTYSWQRRRDMDDHLQAAAATVAAVTAAYVCGWITWSLTS